jgi:glucokinase
LAIQSGGRSNHTLDDLFKLINDLIEAARSEHQKPRGIVVGAPGVTLSDSGTVVWAPSLGWQDLPLRDLLAERFDCPVFVENDVNLTALGEYGFSSAGGVENLVCISIGTGIGAGIILEGKLYRGHHQASGEVGYFVPGVQHLGRRYDDFGALETFASGMGIARRAHELLSKRDGKLPPRDLTTEEVFDLARNGVDWAVKLISEVVDYLAIMIAGVSALLDPEEVILCGGVARSGDLLVEPLKQRLDGIVPFVPRIKVSELGTLAVAMGAIMMVLDATTGHIMVEQRI